MIWGHIINPKARLSVLSSLERSHKLHPLEGMLMRGVSLCRHPQEELLSGCTIWWVSITSSFNGTKTWAGDKDLFHWLVELPHHSCLWFWSFKTNGNFSIFFLLLKIATSAIFRKYGHAFSFTFVHFLWVFSLRYWYAIILTAFMLWTKHSKEVSFERWWFLLMTQMGTDPTSFKFCNCAPITVTPHLVESFWDTEYFLGPGRIPEEELLCSC